MPLGRKERKLLTERVFLWNPSFSEELSDLIDL